MYGEKNIKLQAGFTYFEMKYDDIVPKYGALYCFCDDEELVSNVPGSNQYEIYQNRHKNFTVLNPYEKGREEDAPICEKYLEETYRAKGLSYACNYFIIAGNIAIRTLVSQILYLVGCSTESS